MQHLATKSNRFIYMQTRQARAVLSLFESFLSKIALTFLRHIRVASKQELKKRILKGFNEIDAEPVVHR
jgi:hypothetical protein